MLWSFLFKDTFSFPTFIVLKQSEILLYYIGDEDTFEPYARKIVSLEWQWLQVL